MVKLQTKLQIPILYRVCLLATSSIKYLVILVDESALIIKLDFGQSKSILSNSQQNMQREALHIR